MNEAELESLVAALAPRVAESCRQLSLLARSENERQSDSSAAGSSSSGVDASTQCAPESEPKKLPSPSSESSGHVSCVAEGQQLSTPIRELDSSNVTVILLPDQNWSSVVNDKIRTKFCEEGLLIDKFTIQKSWSEIEVYHSLEDAFSEKLRGGEDRLIRFKILEPEGDSLLQPRISKSGSLNGVKICEIFSRKSLYLLPDRKLTSLTDIICDDT